MDEKDLRTIIEQVLSEMNMGAAAAPAARDQQLTPSCA